MRATEIRDDFQNLKIDKAYKNIVIVFSYVAKIIIIKQFKIIFFLSNFF